MSWNKTFPICFFNEKVSKFTLSNISSIHIVFSQFQSVRSTAAIDGTKLHHRKADRAETFGSLALHPLETPQPVPPFRQDRTRCSSVEHAHDHVVVIELALATFPLDMLYVGISEPITDDNVTFANTARDEVCCCLVRKLARELSEGFREHTPVPTLWLYCLCI